jgi:hypothetical protein
MFKYKKSKKNDELMKKYFQDGIVLNTHINSDEDFFNKILDKAKKEKSPKEQTTVEKLRASL